MAFRGLMCRAVVVNLKSGTVYRGVLWQQRGPLLVVRNAELLDSSGGARPVDGELVVERSNVDFIQVLP